MNQPVFGRKLLQAAFIPVLIAAVSTGVAQGPPQAHGDDQGHTQYHDNGYHNGQDNSHHNAQGNGYHNGQDNSHHNAQGNGYYNGQDNSHHNAQGNGYYNSQEFRFHEDDRRHFEPHYQKDVDHWRHSSHNRPQFVRGQRIPTSYHFQPVPHSYYAEVPPPPPGYQYGYYDGYVVAYDPTTRVIADVLDLVGATLNH
jgi:hypothetical protein